MIVLALGDHLSLTVSTLGISTPRARSPVRSASEPRASSQPPPGTKSVQFNLTPSSDPSSPDKIRKRRQRSSHNNYDSDYDSETSTLLDQDRHDRRHHSRKSSHDDHDRFPSPAPSDETVELPERFDERGRPIPESGEDQLTNNIHDLLGGWLGGSGSDEKGERRRRS